MKNIFRVLVVSGLLAVACPAGMTAYADLPTEGYSDGLNEEEIVSAAAKSDYDNIAIFNGSNYANVRSEAGTYGNVVGKIFEDAAADILETVDGEDGQWYKIRSGKVTGYIKAEYFITYIVKITYSLLYYLSCCSLCHALTSCKPLKKRKKLHTNMQLSKIFYYLYLY